MFWKSHRSIRRILIAGLAALLSFSCAEAKTFTTLHSFAGSPDGALPLTADLVMDKSGNLYGTTETGGNANSKCQGPGCGIVFKLAPGGAETVLYSFCAQKNCSDGANPYAGLIADQNGNLYGTTFQGGAGCSGVGCGTVFKIAPGGTETVLYTFCSKTRCSDGRTPYAGLVMDKSGNLYGTASGGGANCSGFGCGAVFELTTNGIETVLYSFCAQKKCADGRNPISTLLMDARGNLYGLTNEGGTSDSGTVYEITPGTGETVLYSFCSQQNCDDGTVPMGGLIADKSDNLYGTASQGGANDEGTVFELSAGGTYSVLYTFCAQIQNCSDGAGPVAGLVADGAGNLFGTTASGGGGAKCPAQYGCGAVFKLAPNGTESVVYGFCSKANCTDGFNIGAPVILDKGYLYGTAGQGGIQCEQGLSCGTVFRVKD